MAYATALTHKYRRLSRWTTEEGISPYKWLLERLSSLSLPSLPISGGIVPVMWFFSSKLWTQMDTIKG